MNSKRVGKRNYDFCMKGLKHFFILPLLVVSFLFISSEVFSATVTWIGADNANWGDSGNWDTGTVPTSTDDVVINNGTTVKVNVAAQANSVNVASGSGLDMSSGSPSITIFNDGVSPNTGTFVMNGQMNMSASFNHSIIGNGNLTVSGTGTIDFVSGVSRLFNSTSGQTVSVSDVNFSGGGQLGIGLSNFNFSNMTINADGAATMNFNPVATIDSSNFVLNVDNLADFADNKVWDGNNTTTINIHSGGEFNHNGGTLKNTVVNFTDATSIIDNNNTGIMDNVTFNGPGFIDQTSSSIQIQNTIGGDGQATFKLSGTGFSSLQAIGNATLDNVIIDGSNSTNGRLLTTGGAETLTIGSNAVVNNVPTLGISPSHNLVNDGSINYTTLDGRINANFDNTNGIISIASGRKAYLDGGTLNNGEVNIASGGTFVPSANPAWIDGVHFTGDGDIIPDNNPTNFNSVTFDQGITHTIQGGRTSLFTGTNTINGTIVISNDSAFNTLKFASTVETDNGFGEIQITGGRIRTDSADSTFNVGMPVTITGNTEILQNTGNINIYNYDATVKSGALAKVDPSTTFRLNNSNWNTDGATTEFYSAPNYTGTLGSEMISSVNNSNVSFIGSGGIDNFTFETDSTSTIDFGDYDLGDNLSFKGNGFSINQFQLTGSLNFDSSTNLTIGSSLTVNSNSASITGTGSTSKLTQDGANLNTNDSNYTLSLSGLNYVMKGGALSLNAKISYSNVTAEVQSDADVTFNADSTGDADWNVFGGITINGVSMQSNNVTVNAGASYTNSGGSHQTASLLLNNNTTASLASSLKISKDFLFYNTDETNWNLSPTAEIHLNGGAALGDNEVGLFPKFEIGSAAGGGLTNNFAIPNLIINGRVQLTDFVNNGNQGGNGLEDLVINNLTFTNATDRLATNGLNFTVAGTLTLPSGVTDINDLLITTNTNVGQSSLSFLGDGVVLTFDDVTTAGDSTKTSVSGNQAILDDFLDEQFVGRILSDTFYDISTTAVFDTSGGNGFLVRIPYNQTDFDNTMTGFTEDQLRLFHRIGPNNIEDITASDVVLGKYGLTSAVDTLNNYVYGFTDSFSEFGVGVNPEPATLFLLGSGLLGLFYRRFRK